MKINITILPNKYYVSIDNHLIKTKDLPIELQEEHNHLHNKSYGAILVLPEKSGGRNPTNTIPILGGSGLKVNNACV